MADFADKRVLVTGVTSGIGQATAEAFCKAGVKELIAIARREDELKAVAKDWSDRYDADVAAIVLDVRSLPDIEAIAEQHDELWNVDILVNNAGLARGTEKMQEADIGDWQEMVETNVLGLLYMTRHVVPHMVKRQDGHIVNLGSVAGRWVYPGGGVYAATKHAVRALSEGLRMDLQGSGVRVTNIEPGIVETEFSLVRYKGDAEKAKRVYADTRPLKAEDVAEAILWCCGRPSHVNVQEMVLYPTDQAHVGMVHRRAN
ncbi:MAG TPA: SDR family NAD(P)-dependent oxidoreductase [Candidatus Thermoplasmatota archaeon]|nr:SDR family NAD(P)-dependent oxidoreductase [Candidatus Thermoplasmatota archaeon]